MTQILSINDNQTLWWVKLYQESVGEEKGQVLLTAGD